jgi:glycosyltransferase involved in cell wall biosynthesis
MITSTTPKKLLLVITKSNFGGAQRYIYELAVGLTERGYIVAVAAGGNGSLCNLLKEAGITTYHIEGAKRDLSFKGELTTLQSLNAILKSFKPDIVHLNSSKMGVLGSLVARFNRVPRIIFTVHGWPFMEDRPLPWRIMAWIGSYLTALLVDRVILVSKHDQRHTHMPGAEAKCVVVPTGIETFTPLPRAEARAGLLNPEVVKNHEHTVWVGTIGELHANKNHRATIDAVAEFNSTHTNKLILVIIGEGELRAELTEQIELCGLREYVYLVGYKEGARQYLSAFDIYVMSSLKEGLPYGLLEAGILGLPCITSQVGGMPEVVMNLQTGLLTDPHNHTTLSTALGYMIEQSSDRVRLAENVQEHVRKNFSLTAMIEHTNDVYSYHR